MKFKDVFTRARDRIQNARDKVSRSGKQAGAVVKNIVDNVGDEFIEAAFKKAREKLAPATEELPVDFELRQSGIMRRSYERVFPVSHIFQMGAKYERESLSDFMPISNQDYIGRGSYKFVYRLPWSMVVKVSKEVLASDPLFGSRFREVDSHQERFLTGEELELQDMLANKLRGYKKERLRYKFNRLGLERYCYWKVREALPDLVLPTKFFMGVRYRKRLLTAGHSEKITPMDSQIMLAGKHLKEFATAGHKSQVRHFWNKFSPTYDFDFETARFGQIKKKVLVKITEDFRRLIRFTELLALREKLILDIHSENIIITLPDFELKVFDFHLFDEHLYEPSLKFDRPEKDHIEVLEKFIDSLGLEG